ncbi:MAG: FdtA/QdtA family cupin domain-containing protein [Deltaproteobacteria bacterium]|jgi:dTDP-4-dehydrorhamnose 3,5-epimerase-like enzyme|nr:FdtA/QdtA family cupin domain-containing protein [Deltaproteobacteria bacterium]
MNYKIIHIQKIGDQRGKLISLESLKNVPFEIRRVFFIFDTVKNISRGEHAHRTSEQAIICLNGSCYFLLDNGLEKAEIILDDPQMMLYIGKNMWRKMYNFSGNCILMVLANDFYDEKEYIRNYDEFLMASQLSKHETEHKK